VAIFIDFATINDYECIIVGAAAKIAALESEVGRLPDSQRGAVAGSAPFWRKRRTEIEELVDKIQASQPKMEPA